MYMHFQTETLGNLNSVVRAAVIDQDDVIDNIGRNFLIGLPECSARLVGWQHHHDLLA